MSLTEPEPVRVADPIAFAPSVKAIAPASRSSPNSASSLPAQPAVAAP